MTSSSLTTAQRPQTAKAASVAEEARGTPLDGIHGQLRALGHVAGNRAVASLLGPTKAGMQNGRPLDPGIRRGMETVFHHDFGGVRVHVDDRADRDARMLDADAYTAGHDISFMSGRYNPVTVAGQELLAHELAHVVQQEQNGVRLQRQPAGRPAAGHGEREASSKAAAAVRRYQYTLEGRTVILTEQEYAAEKARALRNLARDLTRIEGTAAGAAEVHQDFLEHTHNWAGVISDIIAATAPPHIGIWKWPQPAIVAGRRAIEAGQLDQAARLVKLADQALRDAEHEWHGYIDRTTGGAKVAIQRLEVVRDVSFAVAIGAAAIVAAPALVAAGASTAVTGGIVTVGGGVAGAGLRATGSGIGQQLAYGHIDPAELKKEAAEGFDLGVKVAGTVGTLGAGGSVGAVAKTGSAALRQALTEVGVQSGTGALTTGTSALLHGASGKEALLAAGKGGLASGVGAAVGVAGARQLGTSTRAGLATAFGSGAASQLTGGLLEGQRPSDLLAEAGEEGIKAVVITALTHAAAPYVARGRPSGTSKSTAPPPPVQKEQPSTAGGASPEPAAAARVTQPEGATATPAPSPTTQEAPPKAPAPPSAPVVPEPVPGGASPPAAQTEPPGSIPPEPSTTGQTPPLESAEPHPAEGAGAPTGASAAHGKAETGQFPPPPKDPQGKPMVSDPEIDADVEQSFQTTFRQGEEGTAPSGPGSAAPTPTGPVLSRQQIDAAKGILQTRLSDNPHLDRLWNETAGAVAPTASNSRRLFNNHRARFWRAVRGDPAARKFFEDAGFEFPPGRNTAPVHRDLPGRQGRISLDHIQTRASKPDQALDASNLRLVVHGDNTLLENIQQAMPWLRQAVQP